MTTAPLAATRSANPGVVPPWLTAGIAAAPDAPSASATSAPTVPAAGAASALTGTADAVAGASSVGSPAWREDSGIFGVFNVRAGARIATEQRRAEAQLQDVREFYDRIGVRQDEGNDEAPLTYDPDYQNAAYIPAKDALRIGVDQATGTSYAGQGDVIAHEWGHRVVRHIVGDMVSDEDAAIDESLADTLASAYDGNFTMGEGTGELVRDMLHPERLDHPRDVADLRKAEAEQASPLFVEQESGYGRVHVAMDPHVLASIPNRAAALIGTKLGTDTMASIYLDAMRKHVRPGGQIEGLAIGTLQSAKDMFGTQSQEFQATRDAWDAVGVLDLLRASAADSRSRSGR